MQENLGSLCEFLIQKQPSAYLKDQADELNSKNVSLQRLKRSSLNKAGSKSCEVSAAIMNYSLDRSYEADFRGNPLHFERLRVQKPIFFPVAPKPKKAVRDLPDYSNVQKRVSSFRPKTQSRREDSRIKSQEAQQRVRNELMLKNEHHLLRTMKRELKLESTDKVKSNQLRDGFKQLHHEFDNLKSNSPRPLSPVKRAFTADLSSSAPKIDVMASNVAQRKSIEYSSKQWRQRRGLDVKNMPSRVMHFIKALYELLDEQREGFIKGELLLKAFVNLGVSSEPSTLNQVTS